MWQLRCMGKPYRTRFREIEPPQKIVGYRNAEHSDLPALERLMGIKTRAIFGDVNIGQIYERSCMTVVQFNEELDIVSGVSLCNYPNVPSVPSGDWFNWITVHYGIADITARNTMFIHLLVWDDLYMEFFLESLLTAIFEMTTSCTQVFLVFPPWTPPVDLLEQHMSRIVPKNMKNTYTVQALYTSSRNKKFRIRRAVEEDNDDLVPLINAESCRLKELYGEFYISEITRQPDSCRQLIVSEDENGVATGVMCLNSNVDVDLLNENFELAPYNGLRKPHEFDEIPTDEGNTVGEVLSCLFYRLSKILDKNECVDIEANEEYKEWEINGKERKSVENGIILQSPASNRASIYNRTSVGSSENNVEINIDGISKERQLREKEERRVRIKSNSISDDTFAFVQESLDRALTGQRRSSADSNELSRSIASTKQSADGPRATLLSNEIVDARTKSRESVFVDSIVAPPQRSFPSETEVQSTEKSDFISNILPVPMYHGEINAFVLELFTARNNISEYDSRDFLEAAFECFPDLNYCVMLLPSTQPTLPFLKHFVRVPLRCNKDFPMELYITHRIVLSEEIVSRPAEISDRNNLQDFLLGISKVDTLLADFEKAVNSNEKSKSCYIFECNRIVIGVCIICTENSSDFIKKRYHIEDYISTQHISREDYGRILHFVVMPIFSVHHGYIFREIMRLSGFTVLHYRLYENDASALTRTYPLVTCLNSMMPVSPRRKFEFRSNNHQRNWNNEKINQNEIRVNGDLFSLFITTSRLSMNVNSAINMKVVIVGASDCGLALAEYLALGPTYNSVRFTNLTIISPNGLPFERKHEDIVAKMIPFRGRYCHEYIHLMAARVWINVIYGTVVAINRKEKYVTVMNQGNLTYDYLILSCGMQYRFVSFQDDESQQMRKLSEFEIPQNYFTINDDTEASHLLKNIRLLTKDLTEKKKIVFYGHNMDCYCAVNGLLEFGVNGSWITLIEPKLNSYETHDHVFFNDCEIDTTVANEILRNGIEILSGWKLIGWNVEEIAEGKAINSITVESETELKKIPCDVFINFGEKSVDDETFLAISQAGLVFDGQLVIDPEFRTNDAYIFAADTMTKYSRKFRADSWEHKYYNPIEVGERLGKIIRKVIDQHHDDEKLPTALPKDRFYLTLPVFRAPTVVFCALPGGYHYLHVRKPGKKIPRNVAIADEFYGNVMATGSTTSEIGYFRIRLNTYDSVETITCCSKESFEVQNMISLYGKHEKLLNDLKIRFQKSFISDFFAYFREPWAAAISYDKFECLRVENRATLLSKRAKNDGESLVDDCLRVLLKSNWEVISKEDRQYIESRYGGSLYQQELESSLIDFLQFAEDDLPMYCNPRLLRQMYADVRDSPLFSEL